jgi:lipid-A-disaccharide synthase
MARAAGLIARDVPKALFAVSCIEERHAELARDILKGFDVPVRVFTRRTLEVMKEADVCMVASGTATLELTHFNTPMVVMYRVNPLNYLIARLFMCTRYIGMVNILSGREVVPDRLLWRDDPKGLAREVLDLLTNAKRRKEVGEALQELRTKLDHPGASRQAARSILKVAEELRGRVVDGGSQWPA